LFLSTDTATTEICTLSLHDALPIYNPGEILYDSASPTEETTQMPSQTVRGLSIALETEREAYQRQANIEELIERIDAVLSQDGRSEEHTSELQSRENLVCRLLLEKK